MKKRTKYLIKLIISKAYFPLKRGDDILIFSSQRSGSTWVMELINKEQNTKFINQPFDIANFNPYQDSLRSRGNYHIIYPNEKQLMLILNFYGKIREGGISGNSQWKFWEKDYHFLVNRFIFKIFYAKELADIIMNLYPSRGILLIRHPLDVLISIEKMNWKNHSLDFLNNDYFINSLSNTHKRQLALEVSQNGTNLEKSILSWFLEHENILKIAKKREDLEVFKYEDLLMKKEETFEKLFKHLRLKNADNIYKGFYKASKSSQGLETNNSKELTFRYSTIIKKSELQGLERIFNVFPESGYTL